MLKLLCFLGLLTGLVACQSHQIPNIHLEATLARELIADNQLVRFDFGDSRKINFSWDSIVIIKPYCPAKEFENLGVKNFGQLKYLMEKQSEGECVLLFLKSDICVAYSVVLRSIVDFSSLKNYNSKCFSLVSKANSVKKLRRKTSEKWVYLED